MVITGLFKSQAELCLPPSFKNKTNYSTGKTLASEILKKHYTHSPTFGHVTIQYHG